MTTTNGNKEGKKTRRGETGTATLGNKRRGEGEGTTGGDTGGDTGGAATTLDGRQD